MENAVEPRTRLGGLRRVPPGALLALGVGAASFSPILLRLADGAAPLALSFWRCLAGTLLLLPFARSQLRSLSPTSIAVCAISGAFLALHFASWITSLELTTVASSVLLVSTTPIFVALVAPIVVKERLAIAGWVGIAIAMIGTALLTGVDSGGASLAGNLLALLGGATAGGYVLAGRSARQNVGIFGYAVVTYGVAAAVLLAACLGRGVALAGYDATTWWAIAAVVVGPQLLGHTVINLVLSSIDATTVSVSLMAEPVVATALAALLFDEIPSLLIYPAAAAIFAGIYMVSSADRPEPAPT